MSRKAARAFIARMQTDEAFRTRVLAAKDVVARQRLINAEGFACTVADIESLNKELTEEDLASVSGGVLVGRGGRGLCQEEEEKPAT